MGVFSILIYICMYVCMYMYQLCVCIHLRPCDHYLLKRVQREGGGPGGDVGVGRVGNCEVTKVEGIESQRYRKSKVSKVKGIENIRRCSFVK
jgi:putative component of membrane protein insertase Oxa1/YidC/SpoIIIJ protein YidD